MGLRVNTNVLSLNAQRHMSMVTDRLGSNYARLASGLRIASAKDDAAGLAISERMRSQIRSYTVASRNAQDGLSLAQTAEGAMDVLSNILVRMRELAMQSTNGTYSDEDRAVLDAEFQDLLEEIDRVSSETSFNGISLLDGTSSTIPIQVGLENQTQSVITLDMQDSRATTLAIATLKVDTRSDSLTALDSIDSAITSINTARGNLGAQSNRLSSALRSIMNARENLSAAESRIRDVDIASESADLTRNSIMQQAAATVLQQANVQPQIALSLLQG